MRCGLTCLHVFFWLRWKMAVISTHNKTRPNAIRILFSIHTITLLILTTRSKLSALVRISVSLDDCHICQGSHGWSHRGQDGDSKVFECFCVLENVNCCWFCKRALWSICDNRVRDIPRCIRSTFGLILGQCLPGLQKYSNPFSVILGLYTTNGISHKWFTQNRLYSNSFFFLLSVYTLKQMVKNPCNLRKPESFLQTKSLLDLNIIIKLTDS